MKANLYIAAFYMAGGMALFLLGLVILRENPKQRLNRVTSTMMFLGGLGPLLGAFGTMVQYLNPAQNVLGTRLYFNFFYLWEFFFPQLVLFSLIFPRESKFIRRYPRLWIWIYLPHLIHLLVVLAFSTPGRVTSFFEPQRLGTQLGPFAEAIIFIFKAIALFFSGIYQVHAKFFSAINLLYVIFAIILMGRGYRALQEPLQKRQVRPVIWGLRMGVGLYAAAILLPVLTPVDIPAQLRSTIVVIALFTGAGSVAWAIVRHQFLNLRAIVRQGMVYSAATGLLLGAYLIVIRQLDQLVAWALGVSVPYLDIGFVIMAVIFFQPLLSRMEELSERLFRRDKSDYRNVLQRLTQDITSIFEIEELHEKVASTLQAASFTDRTTLLLLEKEKMTPYVYASAQDEPSEIRFEQHAPALQLLAKASGPISLGELEKHLDSADLEGLRSLGARLLIPIVHGEHLLGLLCLGHKLGGRRYTFEDMATFSVLAGQMAVALVNARLYQESLEKRRFEEELARARQIQEALLPKSCPSGDGFLVSALSRPSRLVGGDYHDFVTVREGRVGIAIGDVSGKGMPAALLMAVLQATLNAQAQNLLSVKETISRVNAHMARFTDPDQFTTFFYGELDLESGSFTYSNAGHNPPLLVHADGQIEQLDRGGLVLGVLEGASYQEGIVALGPKDMLFFYTDGITEAQNPDEEEFGEERLIELLLKERDRMPEDLLTLIFDRANQFANGGLLQQDDATMVVLQLGPSFRH